MKAEFGKIRGFNRGICGKYGDIAQTTTRKSSSRDNLDDLPCLKAAIEKVEFTKLPWWQNCHSRDRSGVSGEDFKHEQSGGTKFVER